MILSGLEIIEQRLSGKVHIEAYNPAHVGPNSYDLTLGRKILVYGCGVEIAPDRCLMPVHGTEWYLDPKRENETASINIPDCGVILTPGTLYLGHTEEEAGSDYYVPMIEGRSSIGRLGLKVHVTAGFGDVGFRRQWTLEMEVTHPVKVYPGMRIAQVYFMTLEGVANKYNGKYVESSEVEASKSWKDFV